jgi:predicted  nucleic acid-binding Zn-ribbon protein
MLEDLSKVKEQGTADAKRVDELESELDDRETTIARLQRTLTYWRAQAKRK